MPQPRDRRVRALEHAARLLELVGGQPEGLRLSELAQASGLGKSTVHGLLATLEALGQVAHVRGRYQPGPRLARLAAAPVAHGERLRAAFAPALRAFSELCREDCFLSVAAGSDSYLVLDALDRDGQPFVPVPDRVRDALPTSAAGKIFLAHDRRLHALLGRRGLLGPALAGDLAQVRERGYALDVQASQRDLNCVALPLRVRGQVVAALSASGAAARLGPAQMQRSAGRAMRGMFDLLKL